MSPARPRSLVAAFVRALAAAVAGASVAYFVLWACAPAASMRPPTLERDPDPRRARTELGFAVTGTRPFEGSQGCEPLESGTDISPSERRRTCVDTQLWLSFRERAWEIAGIAGLGETQVIALGFAFRNYIEDHESFRIAAEGSVGWLFAEVALPAAFALAPGVWIYTAPSAGLRFAGSFRLPVGLSFEGKGVAFRLEAALSTDIDPDSVRGGASAGLGFRW